MDLSIVIPAFNEGAKIKADIEAAAQFLTKHNFEGEIIVVDDGSADNTSEVAHNTFVTPGIITIVINHGNNQGKGYAVRSGIIRSTGNFVMFADSGLCVPYDNALVGLNLIQNEGNDIAHGSRKLNESRIKRLPNASRRFLSKLFRQFVVCFLGIPNRLTDTQCGFKIYNGDVARRLYGQSVTNGFLFDIEIIMRALKVPYKIAEFPVEWHSDPDSRVLPRRIAFSVFRELFIIKSRIARERNK